MTQFRFAAGGADPTSELARFNNQFLDQATREQQLRGQIDNLRTHCSKVREHSRSAMAKVKVTGLDALFSRLGFTDPVQQGELARKLEHLANDDFEAARAWEAILEVVRLSLEDVQEALCVNGMMDAGRLPDAAKLLGDYRAAFKPVEQEARATADAITAAVAELQT